MGSLLDEALLGWTDTYPFALLIDEVSGLCIIALLGVWSLRQRPGMRLSPSEVFETKLKAVGNNAEGTLIKKTKYEKSALSVDDQERIGRKLSAAMVAGHLHSDPELSLWTLSRYVGAPSNYITQTLNEYMEQSFFDFVNTYRIKEAQTLLLSSDQSVLSVAYEVGFNSRSAFYSAFKRLTDMTPTEYRRTYANPQ